MTFIPTGHAYFDLGPAAAGSLLHLEASFNGGTFSRVATVTSIATSLSLITPATKQLFQRSTLFIGSIAIIGTLNGVPFVGTLGSQVVGQGTLTVRVEESPATTSSVATVGLGELIAEAGQSNMAGRLDNFQSYSSTDGFMAVEYNTSGTWTELTEPVDGVGANGGSWTPLLATYLMNRLHVPVGFMPGPSAGGTHWAEWLPTADHLDTGTLYGRLNARLAVLGSVPRVLIKWTGESDAASGNSTATVEPQIESFYNNIWTDRGIRTMTCILQQCVGISPDSLTQQIRNATTTSWGNPHAVHGPNFADMISDDDFHLTTDAHAAIVAQRWGDAIIAMIMGTDSVYFAPACIGMPSNASAYDVVMA